MSEANAIARSAGTIMRLCTDCTQYSILDIGTNIGNTSYLDFIKARDMTSAIMRGVDAARRPFFVIRGRWEMQGASTPICQTYFQRYTDNEFLWHGAGHECWLLCTVGGMKQEQAEFLEELCHKRVMRITPEQAENLHINTALRDPLTQAGTYANIYIE